MRDSFDIGHTRWLIIVVAVTVEPATAAASVSTATTTRGVSFRSCFIYDQGFTEEVETVQTGNSLSASRLIGHFDESETAATLSNFVHNNFGGGNFAVLFE